VGLEKISLWARWGPLEGGVAGRHGEGTGGGARPGRGVGLWGSSARDGWGGAGGAEAGAGELGGAPAEEAFGGFPADAGVGDGDAVAEFVNGSGEGLVAFEEVAFEHDAHEGQGAVAALLDDAAPDVFLSGRDFAGVGVAAVDHDDLGQPGGGELLFGLADAFGVVVGALTSATEDDVAPRIARGADDAGDAVLVHAEESVGVTGGLHGVNGHLKAAVGPVFESDGHGEAAGHFAVGLGLGGAGADGGPGDKIGDVLGDDGIEELGSGGQAHAGDFEQEGTGAAQAGFYVVSAVEVGVVDESFPADGGARFFEVDAHDDFEGVVEFAAEGGQASGVIEGGFRVMNGAGADEDQDPGIGPVEDVLDGFATGDDGASGCLVQRQLGQQGPGGLEPDEFPDMDVLHANHTGNIIVGASGLQRLENGTGPGRGVAGGGTVPEWRAGGHGTWVVKVGRVYGVFFAAPA